MFAIVSLLFWLVVIPFCIGMIPVNFISPSKRNPGLVILAGYFCMWAVFEVVTIPAVLWVKYDNFKVASNCFTVAGILCAAAGFYLWQRNMRGNLFGAKNVTCVFRSNMIEWIIFLALVGFQLYKAVFYTSFDGDDAYYVVESLIAQQADVMYRILPLTGRPTDLDVRHALAVFPMWVAFIAVKSGIHATIVSHVVMPLVLIPLTYLVYYEIGKGLFRETCQQLPVFLIVMCMFQIFGNVSIYTNETFFLTRTWQGKAVAGSLVIPAIFWLLLWIYDNVKHSGAAERKRQEAGLWILLVCVNMTAGICSSIAVFIVSILIAVTGFCLMLTERDFKVLLKLGAACIPNLLYMGIYVVVAYGYLLS